MDAGVVRRYMARLTEAGIAPKLAMLIGVNPLRSAKSANWMRTNLFGTIIPDAMIARMEEAADPAAEGRKICVEYIEELSTIPGVAGVHIMAPGNDAAVPDVINEARARRSRGRSCTDARLACSCTGRAPAERRRARRGSSFRSERMALQTYLSRIPTLRVDPRLASGERRSLTRDYPHSSSASSSSSSSFSAARIFSAMRPEFARIAASILLAMSGLALRNTLAFSRPWPMRWQS